MTEVTHASGDVVAEERKEVLGPNLKIARLLSPQSFLTTGAETAKKIAEMIGIPFEERQLSGFSVEINGERHELLKMMEDLDMVGVTEGVPHLSVGMPHAIPSNSSRSYLVEGGYGVKGSGMVRYDGEVQRGFGLDRFIRTFPDDEDMQDVEDVGGGEDKPMANSELRKSDELWLLFLLNTNRTKCARIMKVFDYHVWHDSEGSYDTGIILREDGRRGVGKKELITAIHDALPTLTDFLIFTPDFFEGDGHNAFLRNGKVVFTDYVTVNYFNTDPVDFMVKLGDTWYFEEIRKLYSSFLSLYGLTSTGAIDYARLDLVSERVLHAISKTQKENKDKIRDSFESAEPKRVVRYAMAGVLASHANTRLLGQEIIGGIIADAFRTGELRESFSIDDMNNVLSRARLPVDERQETVTGGRCGLKRDTDGNLVLEVEINNFGLPINPNKIIRITSADIYEAYRVAIQGEIKKRTLHIPELEENEFKDIKNDIFKNTLYAAIAGAFSNISAIQENPTPNRLKGYDLAAFAQDRIVFTTRTDDRYPNYRATFVIGGMRLTVDGSKLVIDVPKDDLINFDLAELNKIAYTVHVAAEYFFKRGSLDGQVFVISTGST